MKKIIATALACAMMFSLAACSGKQLETTVTDTSGTAAQVTETTKTAKTSETTEATTATEAARESTTVTILAKENYVKNARSKYKSYVKGADDPYYAPEILIKSSYADSVNQEIKKRFESFKKELKKKDKADIRGSEYYVYLTNEGILSVIFMEKRVNNVFHVYNIDVTTGEKVDNARIAQIAGVSSIKTAAMDTLQKIYNDSYGGFPVKDYKVVKENGKELTKEEKNVEATFGEKFINDNMAIGLTDEGKMFFVLTRRYDESNETDIYDINANSLSVYENPARVGSSD